MDNKEELYGKPDSENVEIKNNPCHHFITRFTGDTVGCSRCSNRWIDNGKFILSNGHIKGKLE